MNAQHPHYVLLGNGGNGTIAALQWVLTQSIPNVEFISIATGFSDAAWEERLQTIHAFAKKHGLREQRLAAQPLPLWIRTKNSFPSKKFPWCAQMLKGLVINDYLDDIDPRGQAIVILAKRHQDSRASQQLPEWIDRSPHFAERRVWHPLWQITDADCQQLVHTAGYSWLPHRSLECDPCIYNTPQDFARIPTEALSRTEALEQDMKMTMFGAPIHTCVQQAQVASVSMHTDDFPLNQFDMGCGAPYGCGI